MLMKQIRVGLLALLFVAAGAVGVQPAAAISAVSAGASSVGPQANPQPTPAPKVKPAAKPKPKPKPAAKPKPKPKPKPVPAAKPPVKPTVAFGPAVKTSLVPSPWSWQDTGPALAGLSCSAPTNCVAVGVGGVGMRITGPAPDVAWSTPVPGLTPPAQLADVSCAGANCLAISNAGLANTTATVSGVYASTNGGATWGARTTLPVAGPGKSQLASAISCSGATCAIVGVGGGVWLSKNAGGSWTPSVAGSSLGIGFLDVACPTSATCVAVGAAGKSAVITTATSTAKAIAAPGAGPFQSVACQSATACTASDSLGKLLGITAPFATWTVLGIAPEAAVVLALTCPATQNTCVGITSASVVYLPAGSKNWESVPIGSKSLTDISCAGTNCVAVGDGAAVYASSTAGLTWTAVNEVGTTSTIDCDAAGHCLAGGGFTPMGATASGGRYWSVVSDIAAETIICSNWPSCLSLGQTSASLTTDGGLNWRSRIGAGANYSGPSGYDCVATDVCFGAGGSVIYTTTDGATSGWWSSRIPPAAAAGAKLAGISCPTPTRCLAGGDTGVYIGVPTITPAVGPTTSVTWQWTISPLVLNTATATVPGQKVAAINCGGATCIAAGPGGLLAMTTNAGASWTKYAVPTSATTPSDFAAAICQSNGTCLAGGLGLLYSTANAGTSWSTSPVPATTTVSGFACPGPKNCVAIGSTSLVGTSS